MTAAAASLNLTLDALLHDEWNRFVDWMRFGSAFRWSSVDTRWENMVVIDWRVSQ